MEYVNLIKNFWKIKESLSLKGSIVSYYLFLLETWDNNGNENFEISDIQISKTLKISRTTINNYKKLLRDLGLISFQTEIGFSTFYKIITDYSINRKSKDAGNIAETKKNVNKEVISKNTENTSKTQNNHIQNLEKKSDEKQGVEIVEIPLILQKTELVQENKVSSDSVIKPPAIASRRIDYPTLEEFMEFAQTLEIYEPSMDFALKSKYETWSSAGWRNGYNTPISNWKQTLKNTMPHLKNGGIRNTYQLPKITRPKMTYNE